MPKRSILSAACFTTTAILLYLAAWAWPGHQNVPESRCVVHGLTETPGGLFFAVSEFDDGPWWYEIYSLSGRPLEIKRIVRVEGRLPELHPGGMAWLDDKGALLFSSVEADARGIAYWGPTLCRVSKGAVSRLCQEAKDILQYPVYAGGQVYAFRSLRRGRDGAITVAADVVRLANENEGIPTPLADTQSMKRCSLAAFREGIVYSISEVTENGRQPGVYMRQPVADDQNAQRICDIVLSPIWTNSVSGIVAGLSEDEQRLVLIRLADGKTGQRIIAFDHAQCSFDMAVLDSGDCVYVEDGQTINHVSFDTPVRCVLREEPGMEISEIVGLEPRGFVYLVSAPGELDQFLKIIRDMSCAKKGIKAETWEFIMGNVTDLQNQDANTR